MNDFSKEDRANQLKRIRLNNILTSLSRALTKIVKSDDYVNMTGLDNLIRNTILVENSLKQYAKSSDGIKKYLKFYSDVVVNDRLTKVNIENVDDLRCEIISLIKLVNNDLKLGSKELK